MPEVKRRMPVDPGAPEHAAPETGGVGAGNPDLALRPQQRPHLGQHLHRIPGMLQDVGQDHHVKRLLGTKLPQRRGVHPETPLAGQGCGGLVHLQAFHLKTVVGVQAQAPPLIAPHVQQPPGPLASMETHIPVPLQPEAIQAGREEALPEAPVSAVRAYPGVIEPLV